MPDDGFHVYDTTLRDCAQQEGLNLTVAAKLAIARHLDEFGVGFIEGGRPGAIPEGTEFFHGADELGLKRSRLVAFGATRRPGVRAADDPLVAAVAAVGVRLGIHYHDDTACGVANTLAAVDAGVTHVQGTANGYGERAGNANLFSVVAALQLKQGRAVLPPPGRRWRKPSATACCALAENR